MDKPNFFERTAKRLEPAVEATKNWVQENKQPIMDVASATRKGNAVGGLVDAYDAYNDIRTGGLSNTQKIARGAESIGRTALQGLGAYVGGAFGGPVGAVGGAMAAGTLPDRAAKALNVQLPSQIAANFRGNINDGRHAEPKDYATRTQPKPAYQPQSTQ